MARRIIEEKLESGKRQYRVETNRIFGFIPFAWYTDIIWLDYKFDMFNDAIFDNLDSAKLFCGIPLDRVIERKEILNTKEYKNVLKRTTNNNQ